jgi:hypothetical protein
MKRYLGALSLSAVAVLAWSLLSGPVRASMTGANRGTEVPGPVTLANPTRGVVFQTAGINSDGTVASCFGCVKATTLHLGPGQYQVGFNGNVTANNGWSRWVQVDTLSTENVYNISCTTADRALVTSAIWVACYTNNTGALTDTSFFLFVAR